MFYVEGICQEEEKEDIGDVLGLWGTVLKALDSCFDFIMTKFPSGPEVVKEPQQMLRKQFKRAQRKYLSGSGTSDLHPSLHPCHPTALGRSA